MQKPTKDQIIALAALLQACKYVDELAINGVNTTPGFDASLDSLFALDPPSTEAVFGGVRGVTTGLQLLTEILNGNYRNVNQNILRYSVGAITLQKKLQANPAMLATVRERLEQSALKKATLPNQRDELIVDIASIYRDTLSTLGFRINVTGNMQYLKQDRIAASIRVALFAAVRAALLWNQLGGSRWQLLWFRKQLVSIARNLIDRV